MSFEGCHHEAGGRSPFGQAYVHRRPEGMESPAASATSSSRLETRWRHLELDKTLPRMSTRGRLHACRQVKKEGFQSLLANARCELNQGYGRSCLPSMGGGEFERRGMPLIASIGMSANTRR